MVRDNFHYLAYSVNLMFPIKNVKTSLFLKNAQVMSYVAEHTQR